MTIHASARRFAGGLVFLLVTLFSFASAAQADDLLKPFIMVSNQPGDMAQTVAKTKAALTSNGFEVIGEYAPYDGADIIVVTSPELKAHAAKSDMGGFGAMQRVSITKVKDNIQVAYTNPVYMSNVLRMDGDMADIAAKMAQALGQGTPYGAEGLTARKLRKYHYMFGMPYFDDPYELGEFDSHEAAVKAVEAGLAKGAGGVTQVYRLDIPGKQETVFGVHMTKGCSGDKYIMDRIDFGDLKSTAHLPYEMMVDGKKVVALHAKFRIAQSFPDLSMMGSNSFFSIMCAPDAIDKALSAVVGKDE